MSLCLFAAFCRFYARWCWPPRLLVNRAWVARRMCRHRARPRPRLLRLRHPLQRRPNKGLRPARLWSGLQLRHKTRRVTHRGNSARPPSNSVRRDSRNAPRASRRPARVIALLPGPPPVLRPALPPVPPPPPGRQNRLSHPPRRRLRQSVLLPSVPSPVCRCRALQRCVRMR